MNKEFFELVKLGIMPWEDLKKMIVDYNTAMAKCQGEIKPIAKETSSNIFTYSKYEYIREHTQPTLDKYGIEIEMWPIKPNNEENYFLKIRIGHTSGYIEEKITPIIIPKQNAGRLTEEQLFGKATTYTKRYAYCNIFAIATYEADSDDKKTENQENEPGNDSETPSCSKCGKIMRRRKNTKTGNAFWGCSGYPECTGII